MQRILWTDNLIFPNFSGLIIRIVHFLAYIDHLCPKDVFINTNIFVETNHKGPEIFLAIQSKLIQLCKKIEFAIFAEIQKKDHQLTNASTSQKLHIQKKIGSFCIVGARPLFLRLIFLALLVCFYIISVVMQ